MKTYNKKFILSLLFITLSFLLSMGVGSVYIPPSEILKILMKQIDGTHAIILLSIRVPRALLGFLVGGALGISGSAVQSILKNPLASPYTLGISAGASLGVVMSIVMGISIPLFSVYSMPIIGFLSSLVTIFFILKFGLMVDKRLTNHTIILIGIIFSLFINSFTTLMIALAGDELKRIVTWQIGSLAMRGWSYVAMIWPFVVIGTLGLLFYHRELDLMSFGEENAHSVGLNVKKVKQRVLIFSSILTGSAVAVSGTIGFIGLVAPHIVRKIHGNNHRFVLPYSFLYGGSFLMLTDLVARIIISPSELPVGAITALIGAPFFIIIYFYKRS